MERCPTCHQDASRVSQRCRDCGKRCHALCGESVTEGYASFLRCTACALALASVRLDGLDGAENATAAGGSSAASDQPESPAPKRKRDVQNVTSIAQRRKVVKWMARQDATGLIHFQTAAVKQFPDIFRGDNIHAHVQKASQWWRARAAILEAVDDAQAAGQPQLARLSAKALTGRGRKRSAWVQWLYPKLHAEASRLQGAGVRTTIPVLRSTAQRILESSSETFNRDFVDPSDNRPIVHKITSRWIQAFCKAHPDIYNHSRAAKARATADPDQVASDSDGHTGDDADDDNDNNNGSEAALNPLRQRVASSTSNSVARSNDVANGTLRALVGLGEKLLQVERGRVELMQKQFEFEMESRREEMALRREIEQQRQREFELTYQAQQAKYELDRMALEAKLQKAGLSLQRQEN